MTAIYYITKYALTDGGQPEVRTDDTVRLTNDQYARVVGLGYLKLGSEIFTDEAEAKANIIARRDRKIASLRRQIEKLEKIQ